MKIQLIFLFFIYIFLFTACKVRKKDENFKKINFDWSNDYIGEMASGFEPNINFKDGACLRTGLPQQNSIAILYETKRDFDLEQINVLEKGFFVNSKFINTYYYIVIYNENKDFNYVTDLNDLLNFFDEINTMEEALMIAKIKDFNIDYNDPRGGSFRKVKNGFEFFLMKSEGIGFIEFRQYLVSVDKKGFIKSEKKEIYCSGYEECYK